MKLLEQLLDEVTFCATHFGAQGDMLAVYPKWAYDLIWQHTSANVMSQGHSGGIPRISYFTPVGLVTIEPGDDDYVTLYERYRNGYVWKCFDPIPEITARRGHEPVKKSCQHQWAESQGLFSVWKNCSKCGAKHEDLQSA
jgi:hypothetical protein